MNVGLFLKGATQALHQAGVDSARLDCLILLEDALQKDRAIILAHPELEILAPTEVTLNKKIAQRATHIPLAYIRGKAQFYGREFIVDPHVLVPRPETETMITLLKASQFSLPANSAPLRVADVGTGSGCLGITAALEFAGASLDLYDIDSAALKVATHNAQAYGLHPHTYQENLLGQATTRRYNVVLANLPYVPLAHPINTAATHEPTLAIFAGEDGLDAYRNFWDDIERLEQQPSYIFTESLLPQHKAVTQLAERAGYTPVHHQGLVQQFAPKTNL